MSTNFELITFPKACGQVDYAEVISQNISDRNPEQSCRSRSMSVSFGSSFEVARTLICFCLRAGFGA